mmetsp:Transcript_29579/g.61054  ORF Transcript_29579/g.61054 Transcript_29579/m.61054 type:complete len:80 (-) Transcript_29579:181-420(-)
MIVQQALHSRRLEHLLQDVRILQDVPLKGSQLRRHLADVYTRRAIATTLLSMKQMDRAVPVYAVGFQSSAILKQPTSEN